MDKELKAESFEKWLTEQLLPNLPKNSIIVLDNASTHSRQYSRIPTQANNKKFTIDWLTENNIPYPENALKIELLDLVKKKSTEKILYSRSNYRKCRPYTDTSPPYHCHLNPIEMVWAQIKQFFGKHNLNNNKEQIKQLILKSFNAVTTENWKNYINHVKKI